MEDLKVLSICVFHHFFNGLFATTTTPTTNTKCPADIHHLTLPCHRIVSRSRGWFRWAVQAVAMTTRNCGWSSSLDAWWERRTALWEHKRTRAQKDTQPIRPLTDLLTGSTGINMKVYVLKWHVSKDSLHPEEGMFPCEGWGKQITTLVCDGDKSDAVM